MEDVIKRAEELVAMVKEQGGACIVYIDPCSNGKNMQLMSEGYEKNLAMLIGTAMLADADMNNYITRGVEAAQYVENKKKENDKVGS